MRNIWVKLFWPKIRPFQKELRFFFNIQTMNFPFCEKCSCVLQEIWNFAGRKYTLKNCANPHFKWRSHRGRTYFATGPELWIRWKTHWVRWWTTSWPSTRLATTGSSPRLDLHLSSLSQKNIELLEAFLLPAPYHHLPLLPPPRLHLRRLPLPPHEGGNRNLVNFCVI